MSVGSSDDVHHQGGQLGDEVRADLGDEEVRAAGLDATALSNNIPAFRRRMNGRTFRAWLAEQDACRLARQVTRQCR